MRISVESNLKDLSRQLSYIQREQVPFSASVALNNVAGDVAKAITVQMGEYLDNPTPFTEQAYMYRSGKFKGERSTKRKLYVDIIPGQKQAAYLKFQIQGGIRNPVGAAILVPTALAPKNKYGNITKGTRKKFVEAQGKLFQAGRREKKTPGVYRRVGDRVEPMAYYVERAQYKPIFPIDKIAAGVVKNRFGLRFDQALKRALASAR